MGSLLPFFGDVAGALGSTVGSIYSSNKYLKGVKDTNAANLAIQRETNAANLSMMREQNDWNLAQWKRENDYNSPAAQRARLLQAGINPASMVSNGNASSVQSVAGSPAQAVTMQPPAMLPNAFSSLLGLGSDYLNSLRSSEAAKQDKMRTIRDGIDTYTYFDRKMVQFQKEYADLKHQQNLNEEQQMRLADLPDEIEHNRLMRDKASRNVDAEYDNLIRTGRKLDAEANELEHSTIRLDKETAERIASWKSESQVKWFLARISKASQESQSGLNAAQVKQFEANVDKMKNDLRVAKNQESAETALKQYAASIAKQDLRVRTYTADMAAIQLQAQFDMSESEIKQIINRVFGIDVGTFFHSVNIPK